MTIFLFSCTKGELNVPEKLPDDSAPDKFKIEVNGINHNSATVNWTESISPDHKAITYSVELSNKIVANDLSIRSFKLENLKAGEFYKGAVIAKDSDGRSHKEVFEFQTTNAPDDPPIDPTVKFVKTYTLDGYSSTGGHTVKLTNDGGYIATATITDSEVKLLLVKFDSLGNIQWYKVYNDNPNNIKLLVLPDGYLISSRSLIYRVDLNGNLLWKKEIDLHNSILKGELMGILLSKDNHIIAYGKQCNEYTLPIDPDTKLFSAAIIKLDLQGNIIWKKEYGDKKRNIADDAVEDANGNIYFYGTQETKTEYMEMWVGKVTGDGDLIWQKNYTDIGRAISKRIKLIKDNHILLLGFTVNNPRSTINILKTDIEGNLVKRIAPEFGSVGETAYDMDLTADGGIAVTGSFEGLESSSLALFKFSPSLDLTWHRSFNLSKFTLGKSILETPDHGFIITGYTTNGMPSMFLLKTNSEGKVEQ